MTMRILCVTFLLFIFCFGTNSNLKEGTQDSFVVKEQRFSKNPYDLTPIKNLVKPNNYDIPEDEKVKQIEKAINSIILGLLHQAKVPYNKAEYNTKLIFFNNKIKINSKEENRVAVQRDELKRQLLINEKLFYEMYIDIIKGLNSYKNKKYYMDLLQASLLRLKTFSFKSYENTYEKLQSNKDKVSLAFVNAFDDLKLQIKAQEVVVHYLQNKIKLYRSSLIFDDLSFTYLVDGINKIPIISYVNEIIEYYILVSVGEIIVAVVMVFILMMVFKKLLPYLGLHLKNYLLKHYSKKGDLTFAYLQDSVKLPFSLFFYIFLLQLIIFLLIENPYYLEQASPWFNTAYIAIVSYGVYMLLQNAIVYYSDQFFKKYPNVRKEMIDFILRIGKVTIFIFVLLFLLMQLGFDIKAILASLGIGGIAVALAAKDTLTNFFGSLNIITDNSFSQGDWIQTDKVEGTVIDIRMRTTRIRTFSNAMITVPNSDLANASIINWSKRKIGRRIKMSLGITYSSKMSDIQNLAKDIKEMLEDHPGIATKNVQIEDKEKQLNLLQKEDLLGIKRTLLVYIDEYSDSSINIFIYCFSRSPDWEEWLSVKEDIIVKINNLVYKNNCEFAFPSQTIYLENE